MCIPFLPFDRCYMILYMIVLSYFASFTGYEDDILDFFSILHVQGSKFGRKFDKFGGKSFFFNWTAQSSWSLFFPSLPPPTSYPIKPGQSQPPPSLYIPKNQVHHHLFLLQTQYNQVQHHLHPNFFLMSLRIHELINNKIFKRKIGFPWNRVCLQMTIKFGWVPPSRRIWK